MSHIEFEVWYKPATKLLCIKYGTWNVKFYSSFAVLSHSGWVRHVTICGAVNMLIVL